MTRHKHTHTGLVTPQLPQLWLTAVLRLFAMLVSNVASTLQMIRRREAVNATQPAPAALPRETSDTNQETHAVQPDSPIALMLSSTQSVRPSKHKRVLTNGATPTKSFSAQCRESRLAQHGNTQLTVPLIPANAGTQDETSGLFRFEASIPYKAHRRSWIPAFAGMSGDGPARITAS